MPQLDTGLRDGPTGVAFIDAQAQRKSTYSGGGDGDTCVEIATLSVPTPAFTALVEHVKVGDIDHPWSEGASSA